MNPTSAMGLLAGTKSGGREIRQNWTCFIIAPQAKLSLSCWNRAPHALCMGGSRSPDYLRGASQLRWTIDAMYHYCGFSASPLEIRWLASSLRLHSGGVVYVPGLISFDVHASSRTWYEYRYTIRPASIGILLCNNSSRSSGGRYYSTAAADTWCRNARGMLIEPLVSDIIDWYSYI